MACTTTDIQNWCSGINIQDCACVAQAYCAQFGTLPTDLSTFDSWGQQKGYLNPTTGVWTCSTSGGGTTSGGSGGTPAPSACAAGQINVLGKCYAEGLVLAGVGVGLLFLMRRKH